jgi:hypothetical protein
MASTFRFSDTAWAALGEGIGERAPDLKMVSPFNFVFGTNASRQYRQEDFHFTAAFRVKKPFSC